MISNAMAESSSTRLQPGRGTIRPSAPMTDTVTSTQSAASTGEYGLGMGLSTARNLTFTETALTGWMDLGDGNAIQAFAALGGIDPFVFGVGGLFKRTVLGSEQSGLHLGGGLGIGTVAGVGATGGATSNFAFALNGIAGFHFIVPNTERMLISLDGGPAMTIIDDNIDVTMGAIGSLLGLSVIYLF